MKIWKWPILYIIIQMFVLFLLALIYIVLGYNPSDFGLFLSKYRFLLGILLGVIFIPWLIIEYKKLKLENQKIKIKSSIFLVIFGIAFCLLYNVVMYYVSDFFQMKIYVKNDYILSMLLTTSIIGPIIEEYMFRGIMYNELKKKYSVMKSILLCTFIFTLLHVTIIQMIYAFAFGFILIYVYERYKSIKAPIILHITSNIVSVLIMNVLIQNNFIVNYSLFIISLFVFTIIVFLHKKSMI